MGHRVSLQYRGAQRQRLGASHGASHVKHDALVCTASVNLYMLRIKYGKEWRMPNGPAAFDLASVYLGTQHARVTNGYLENYVP